MIEWALIAQRMGYSSEKELFTTLYIDHEFTIKQLASAFKVSTTCISYRLRNLNIPVRTQGGANNDFRTLEKLAYLDPRTLHHSTKKELSSLLGVEEITIYKAFRRLTQ